MAMTNKQFQGFLRLFLESLLRANQDDPEVKKLIAIIRSMLEDN